MSESKGNVLDARDASVEKKKWNSQQTGHIDTMLVQCWADVVDGGPALVQHWAICPVCWVMIDIHCRLDDLRLRKTPTP